MSVPGSVEFGRCKVCKQPVHWAYEPERRVWRFEHDPPSEAVLVLTGEDIQDDPAFQPEQSSVGIWLNRQVNWWCEDMHSSGTFDGIYTAQLKRD